MLAVSIVGLKKSGKTSLVGLLADALEEKGHSTGIIKFTSHGLERQHSDTFWLMRPGRTVAGLGQTESAMFWSRRLPLTMAATLLNASVLLLEGGEEYCATPRIICLKDPKDATELAFPTALRGKDLKLPGLAIASVGAAPEQPYGEHYAEVTPENAADLADLILQKGFLLPEGDTEHNYSLATSLIQGDDHISSKAASTLSLCIDGREISVNALTAHLIKANLTALLQDCEIEPGQEAELHLKF